MNWICRSRSRSRAQLPDCQSKLFARPVILSCNGNSQYFCIIQCIIYICGDSSCHHLSHLFALKGVWHSAHSLSISSLTRAKSYYKTVYLSGRRWRRQSLKTLAKCEQGKLAPVSGPIIAEISLYSNNK